MKSEPPPLKIRLDAQTKTFLVSAVAASVAVWQVSFNLGAFGVVFFSQIFTAWVTASATFLGCLWLSSERSPVGRGGLALMAFPTVGFIFTFVKSVTENSLIDFLGTASALISYVFCLPYTVYVIFSITHEEVVKLSRQMRVKLITIAAIVGLIGYFVGSHNYLFLSCDDFKISGNDLPTNCRQTPVLRIDD